MIRMIMLFLCVLILSGCASDRELLEVEETGENLIYLISPDFEIRRISSDKLLEIEAGVTYDQIIRTLGSTKDIGSGLHLAAYIVDDDYELIISYSDPDVICEKSGEDMLLEIKND